MHPEALPNSDADVGIRVMRLQAKVTEAKARKTAATKAKTSGSIILTGPVRHHPLFRRTLLLLDGGFTDRYGRIEPRDGCLSIVVTKPCLPRVCHVMDGLIAACEARGWTVEIPEGRYRGGTWVTLHDAQVPITLEERIGRTLRDPNESELQYEQARGRPHKYPFYDYHPRGLLALRLGFLCKNDRHTWREGRCRMEALLPRFLSALDHAGVEAKKFDEQVAAREKRQAEEETRRWKHNQAIAAEQERVDRLLHEAETWDWGQKVRAFIDARIAAWRATGVFTAEGTTSDSWVKWARLQADRLDPLKPSPPSILDEKPPTFWDLYPGAPNRPPRNPWRKVPSWVQ